MLPGYPPDNGLIFSSPRYPGRLITSSLRSPPHENVTPESPTDLPDSGDVDFLFSRAPSGEFGLPGTTLLLLYDSPVSNNVLGNGGDFKFSNTGTFTGGVSGGAAVTRWDLLKAVDYLFMSDEDKNDVDVERKLNLVRKHDLCVLWLNKNAWIEWEIVSRRAAPGFTTGGVYRFQLAFVASSDSESPENITSITGDFQLRFTNIEGSLAFPDQVKGVSVTTTGAAVTFNWTAFVEANWGGGTAASRKFFLVLLDTDGNIVHTAEATAGASSHTFNNVAGGTYTGRMRAETDAGVGIYSNARRVTVDSFGAKFVASMTVGRSDADSLGHRQYGVLRSTIAGGGVFWLKTFGSISVSKGDRSVVPLRALSEFSSLTGNFDLFLVMNAANTDATFRQMRLTHDGEILVFNRTAAVYTSGWRGNLGRWAWNIPADDRHNWSVNDTVLVEFN